MAATQVSLEEVRVSDDGASVYCDVRSAVADAPGLPAVAEATAADAVFLRLMEVTHDPGVRNFLRRILAVAD
jgi:hypothetical protein